MDKFFTMLEEAIAKIFEIIGNIMKIFDKKEEGATE